VCTIRCVVVSVVGKEIASATTAQLYAARIVGTMDRKSLNVLSQSLEFKVGTSASTGEKNFSPEAEA
jgi:hypothetical protein